MDSESRPSRSMRSERFTAEMRDAVSTMVANGPRICREITQPPARPTPRTPVAVTARCHELPSATAANTAAYHNPSRNRIELRRDDVSHPTSRLDEVAAEFLADVGDMHFHQVRKRVVGFVEDVIVN